MLGIDLTVRCVNARVVIHQVPSRLRQVLLTRASRTGHVLSEQRAELRALQKLLMQNANQIHCRQTT